METLKFCMKHAKKYMFKSFLVQLISFSLITIDLLIPILSGMLLNYIIKGEAVKPGDGGIFSFILSGAYGEVQTFELFFNIAALFLGLIALRLILLYARDCNRERIGIKLENDLRHLTFKKLLELDSKTGLIKQNSSINASGDRIGTLHGDAARSAGTLVAKPGKAPALTGDSSSIISGADLVYNKDTGYYYLFTTYGVDDTNYNIRVARSTNVDAERGCQSYV